MAACRLQTKNFSGSMAFFRYSSHLHHAFHGAAGQAAPVHDIKQEVITS
jgi:hypothetical protein